MLAKWTGGAPKEWSVEPALPKNLAVCQQTGAISGTLVEQLALTEHKVTARNLSGQASAVIAFAVTVAPPIHLVYPDAKAEFPFGGVVYLTPVVILRTQEAKKPAVNWQLVRAKFLKRHRPGMMPKMLFTVDPELPSGLVLTSKTGIITGMPGKPFDPATYRVTARNDGGEISVDLHFGVRLVAPSSLSFPEAKAVYFTGQPVALSPLVEGLVDTWRPSPRCPPASTWTPPWASSPACRRRSRRSGRGG